MEATIAIDFDFRAVPHSKRYPTEYDAFMGHLASFSKHCVCMHLAEKVGPAGVPLIIVNGLADNVRAWLREWYFGHTSSEVNLDIEEQIERIISIGHG